MRTFAIGLRQTSVPVVKQSSKTAACLPCICNKPSLPRAVWQVQREVLQSFDHRHPTTHTEKRARDKYYLYGLHFFTYRSQEDCLRRAAHSDGHTTAGACCLLTSRTPCSSCSVQPQPRNPLRSCSSALEVTWGSRTVRGV